MEASVTSKVRPVVEKNSSTAVALNSAVGQQKFSQPVVDRDSMEASAPDRAQQQRSPFSAVQTKICAASSVFAQSKVMKFPALPLIGLPLGGLVVGLPLAGWAVGTALLPVEDPHYATAQKQLQGVADSFAVRLGLQSPRVLIHKSWPLSPPYMSVNLTRLGIGPLITLGKDVIDKESWLELRCDLGREMAHFCANPEAGCELPAHFTPYSVWEGPHQREYKADYIGSLLCGKDDFMETMQRIEWRTESNSWLGKWQTTIEHQLQFISARPSLLSRQQNIMQSSPDYYPGGYGKKNIILAAASAYFAGVIALTCYRFLDPSPT